METKGIMEDVLVQAIIVGERAPVDAIADPTVDGFSAWKESLLTYFGCAIDNFLAENRNNEEIKEEIMDSMKAGVKKLILRQPYVDVPLQPMSLPARKDELRIIEEIFSELKVAPHHCTH